MIALHQLMLALSSLCASAEASSPGPVIVLMSVSCRCLSLTYYTSLMASGCLTRLTPACAPSGKASSVPASVLLLLLLWSWKSLAAATTSADSLLLQIDQAAKVPGAAHEALHEEPVLPGKEPHHCQLPREEPGAG